MSTDQAPASRALLRNRNPSEDFTFTIGGTTGTPTMTDADRILVSTEDIYDRAALAHELCYDENGWSEVTRTILRKFLEGPLLGTERENMLRLMEA